MAVIRYRSQLAVLLLTPYSLVARQQPRPEWPRARRADGEMGPIGSSSSSSAGTSMSGCSGGSRKSSSMRRRDLLNIFEIGP